MTQESPARMLPKVQIRVEEKLRQQLMQAAFKADRSLNAEIVARLEKSFEEDAAANAIAERMEEHDGYLTDHEKRIGDLERRMDDVFHMAGWRDYPGNQD
jgi:Arc-like DNA binding domain